MSVIVCNKEAYIRGRWETFGAFEIKGETAKELWPLLHKEGNVYKHTLSAMTLTTIMFRKPVCPIHTLREMELFNVREQFGRNEFDRVFGCWPFDFIDWWTEEDSKNQIIQETGILAVRLVCWEEK